MDLERGMPSKRKSSACVDYVPALCTHRPSLLPIECQGEIFGPWSPVGLPTIDHGKLLKSCYLEEVKVVTRFP